MKSPFQFAIQQSLVHSGTQGLTEIRISLGAQKSYVRGLLLTMGAQKSSIRGLFLTTLSCCFCFQFSPFPFLSTFMMPDCMVTLLLLFSGLGTLLICARQRAAPSVNAHKTKCVLSSFGKALLDEPWYCPQLTTLRRADHHPNLNIVAWIAGHSLETQILEPLGLDASELEEN